MTPPEPLPQEVTARIEKLQFQLAYPTPNSKKAIRLAVLREWKDRHLNQ